LQSWTPGVEQVLVRNPNWFGPKPEIEKIIYRQVPESSNRVALISTGQAQIARDLTQDELDKLSKNPNVKVQCFARNQFVYVALNFARGRPTANQKVREALAYAVPYRDIINSVYRGRARRLYGMVTSSYVDYLGKSAYPYRNDLTKAKQLLRASGYRNGFKATILVDSGVPEHRRIAVLLKENFGKIGVNLSINTKPTSAFQDAAFGRKFGDMVLSQNYAFILDPDYHSNVWLPSLDQKPPNFNFGAFGNPQFNKIQVEGVRTRTGPKRTALMKQLQRIFIRQLPWLSIANAPTCFAFSKNISGYVWHTHNQIIFSDLKVGP
jgi:peptide/nickel transport system substrate-binding protein